MASLALQTQADVAVPQSDWSGSMVFNSTNGGKYDGREIAIHWNITRNAGTGIYTYEYNFTNNGKTEKPSHFILEVSDNFTNDNLLSANGATELRQYTVGEPSNPDMPADIYGIKFDYESPSYVFTTDRMPVYGDVYTKKGSARNVRSRGTAWNDGFGVAPTNDLVDYSKWVARPDSIPGAQVPSPAAVFAGMFLCAGSILQRRRRPSNN